MSESLDLCAGSSFADPPNFDAAALIAGAVRISDVESSQLRWLWPKRIPLGRVTLLASDPGLGKSLLALDIAARLSRGTPWPDEKQGAGSMEQGVNSTESDSELPAPCSVLLLTAEDNLADTIRPRLEALGADPSKIVAIPAIPGRRPKSSPRDIPDRDILKKPAMRRAFELRCNLQHLRRLLEAMPDCRLVILDPISAYLGDANQHASAEIQRFMLPLAALALERGLAMLAITHLRKKGGPAIYRTMGSLAFVATARAAWIISRDPDNRDRRFLMPLKNNLAPDVTGLAFTIESHPTSQFPVIRWCPSPIESSADNVLDLARPIGRPDALRRDAIDWLQSRLAAGPRPASEIKNEAEAHGIYERTLRRAFRELGGVALRENSSPTAKWLWEIPSVNCPASKTDGQYSGEEFWPSVEKHEDSAEGETNAPLPT